MAYDSRDLVVRVIGDTSDFVKATGQIGDSTKEASSKMADFADGAKKASLVLAGVGAGLGAYEKSATDYTVNLVKGSKELSRQTGMNVEDSSRLVYVAQRMGISVDQASTVFGIFSKQINKATEDIKNSAQAHAVLQNKIDATKIEITQATDEITKNGDKTGALSVKLRTLNTDLNGLQSQLTQSQDAFQKMGISVVDSSGNTKDFNTLLLETADKFKSMQDGSEKTALAMQLFGRSGKDMIPILNQGSQGIQDLEKQADKLGLTLNAQTIGAVTKYIKAQKDLQDSTNALKVQVGSLTAPVLANFDNSLNGIMQRLLAIHGPMHTAVVDTLAFGGPVAGVAGGIANFAGNLASASPILSKFGGLLANPYALAVGLAAVGITILGVKFVDSMDKAKHLGQAFDEQQDKLTGLNAKYGSSVTLLQIFQDRQKMAEDAVTDATNKHKAALDAIAPAQEIAKQKADALKQAQDNVKAAFDQFGLNSPQYKQATDNLAAAEYNYNQKLLDNWGLEVNVKTSEENLSAARRDLFNKTSDLKYMQDLLNNGLDSGVTVISKFGPVASQQIGAIDTLQNHIGLVVASFTGMNSSIQAQVPRINEQLGGISNALQIYQGQAANLNAAMSGASSNSRNILQGASGSLQAGHNAEGTDNWRGGLTWVGEKGPELVNLPKGSQVIPNNKSTQMSQPSQSSVHMTVNVGMYAGMPVEKRQIALELYKELVRAARSQGVSMPMIGAVGVQ